MFGGGPTVSGVAPRMFVDQLRRGTSVGRYTILKPIGSGGMGVVYQAHDPELDRPVAIKLLSPGGGDEHATQQRATDLLREGRIAAKLAHPNIVRVYDVGSYGSELFIAMEYLEGETLETWLQTADPSPRERLSAFVDAGRGLAAAHAARLVHGDFKPRNVMVTQDGRIVVLDFGLGCVSEQESEVDESTVTENAGLGGVAGTPLFMAPELFEGQATSAASDQFAYCVSLYTALVSAHPFGGSVGVQQLGEPPTAPPRRLVSPRVWRALRRGLAADPDERFEGMDELLSRIAPRSVGSRWALAAGVGAALGTLGYVSVSDGTPSCESGRAQFAEVWGEGARPGLAAEHEGKTWEFFAANIDAYGEAWTEQWTSACRDRSVRMTQSAELFDRRVLCLETGLAGVGAIVDALHAGDATLAEAVSATSSLTPPKRCGDTEALLAGEPPPTDPEAREALAALRREIAGDRTRLRFPKHRDAVIERGPALVERADALASYKTRARAEFNVGKAQLDGETLVLAASSFRRAFRDAEIAGDDDYAARLTPFLVHTEAVQGHPEQAQVWADVGLAKIARVDPDDHQLTAELATARGVAARHRGDTQRAVEILAAARDAYAQTGVVNSTLGDLLNALSTAYRDVSEYEKAVETALECLEARTYVYGDTHPLVGESLFNLAFVYMGAGDPASARRYLDKARVILEADTKSARKLIGVAALLGPLLAEDGKLDEAARVIETAVAKARLQLPKQAYELNPALVNLAQIATMQGRHEEAIVLAQEAIAICEVHRGADYPPMAQDLIVLASALTATKQYEAAQVHLRRAQTLADHPNTRQEVAALLKEARARSEAAPPP